MFDVPLTLRVFAAYLAGLAAGFVFLPARLLPLIGFEPPRDFWIRVLGGILAILALYYVLGARAARDGELTFARWTVWGRLPLLPFYGALVAFTGAPALLLAVGVFESGCGAWTGWALRRSRAALAMVVWIVAIVSGVGGAHAADSYRFHWSQTGPPPKTLQGAVLLDGERYRVEFEATTGADPVASDVTLRTAAGAPETFLNTELRTHFVAPQGPASARFPFPGHLGLVPIPGRRTVRETAFQCESDSPASSSPAPAPPALDASERHVRLSVTYRVTIDLGGGSRVVGDVSLEATYRTLPAIRVPTPEFFRPRIHTADDSLDARIATCLALVEGLPRTFEVRVKRAILGGVTDSYEQTLRTFDHRQVTAVDPAKFKVPANYRYQEPEMAGPGH